MTIHEEPAAAISHYEYGVRFVYDLSDEPHRTGMTETEACEWVAESEEMGFVSGAFSVIRRKVGQWEPAAGEELTNHED